MHGPNLTHWDEISRIGRLKIVQLTVLIPIFGYLIIFGDWFKQNFTVFGEYPMWKMYFLYFGFTLVALASLAYNFRCPRLVIIYGSAVSYVTTENQIMNDRMAKTLLLNLCLEFISNPLQARSKFTQNVATFIDNINPEEYENVSILEEAITRKLDKAKPRAEFMYSYFEVLEECRSKSRYLVVSLYLLGFLLIAIPSIAMFIAITSHAFSHILF